MKEMLALCHCVETSS